MSKTRIAPQPTITTSQSPDVDAPTATQAVVVFDLDNKGRAIFRDESQAPRSYSDSLERWGEEVCRKQASNSGYIVVNCDAGYPERGFPPEEAGAIKQLMECVIPDALENGISAEYRGRLCSLSGYWLPQESQLSEWFLSLLDKASATSVAGLREFLHGWGIASRKLRRQELVLPSQLATGEARIVDDAIVLLDAAWQLEKVRARLQIDLMRAALQTAGERPAKAENRPAQQSDLQLVMEQLRRMQDKHFTAVEANQALVGTVNQVLRGLGQRVKCSNCGRPALLSCTLTGRRGTGARSGLFNVYHNPEGERKRIKICQWFTSFPAVILTAAPPDQRRRASRRKTARRK